MPPTKIESTAGVFKGILQNFRIILGRCFSKENRGGLGSIVTLGISGLHFLQGSYSYGMKQSFFSTNFHLAKLFNLDYGIHFYRPKKGYLLSRF